MKPIYEVEMELLDFNASKNAINTYIGEIFKILHDTYIVYTFQEYMYITKYINISLDGKIPDIFVTVQDRNQPKEWKAQDPYIFSQQSLFQARNLHNKDLVGGGIVGNPRYTYKVTIKADGIRKLLVFAPISEKIGGVWLVMAKDEANLLFRFPLQAADTESFDRAKTPLIDYIGYILEGEIIPKHRRRTIYPKQPYWFLAYDCLASPNEKNIKIAASTNIQSKNHNQRMGGGAYPYPSAQHAVDALKENSVILAETKKFYGFNTSLGFFTATTELDKLRSTVGYEEDGFIYMPEEMPYNLKVKCTDAKRKYGQNLTPVYRCPLFKRVLTTYPDICKWKSKEDVTIDFAIQWIIYDDGTRTIRLMVMGPKGQQQEFTGSKKFPFSVDMINHKHPLTMKVPSETIVEYRWDYTQNILVPFRLRGDKPKPNRAEFAIDNWDLIHKPIELSTITGKGFQLMRNYHNRLKTSLYKNVIKSEKTTLLDIGSGRGGDVHRWKAFSKIIAVEPNIEHINDIVEDDSIREGLITRVQKVLGQEIVPIIYTQNDIDPQMDTLLNSRVIIINNGGENTDLITQVVQFTVGQVDVVALMLSLSFFYQNNTMLQSLAATIGQNLKPQGQGILFTIDGRTVSQSFQPRLGSGAETDEQIWGLPNYKVTLRFTPRQSKLWINIDGTIVQNQTEWLVYLSDLDRALAPYNLALTNYKRADGEVLLNTPEGLLTRMYTSAAINKRIAVEKIAQEVAKIEEVEEVEVEEDDLTAAVDEVTQNLRGASISSPRQAALSPTEKIIPEEIIVVTPVKLAPPVIPVKAEKRTPPTLPMLNVAEPTDLSQPGIGEDFIERINVKWYTKYPVVRIAAIADGSCFFHAYLKAFYAPYANNNSYGHRVQMVKQLRLELAGSVYLPDEEYALPDGTTPTFYETAGNGYLLEYAKIQEQGIDFTESLGYSMDFTPQGISKILAKKVGNEIIYDEWISFSVIPFIASVVAVDIYLFRTELQNLQKIEDTVLENRIRQAVLIAGNGSHYETLGIVKPDGIQTVFNPDDEFLHAYIEHFSPQASPIEP